MLLPMLLSFLLQIRRQIPQFFCLYLLTSTATALLPCLGDKLFSIFSSTPFHILLPTFPNTYSFPPIKTALPTHILFVLKSRKTSCVLPVSTTHIPNYMLFNLLTRQHTHRHILLLLLHSPPHLNFIVL